MSDNLFEIFYEDEGAGCFYVYKQAVDEVLAQIQIYTCGD
jgi:hypothetical protein